MKAATITEIKKELKEREPAELVNTILRLARFKKDNKELLTYLLYESENESHYINSIKYEIDEQMTALNKWSIYYLKKSLRKVLRNLDKKIRYSGIKETEVELRIYFCQKLIEDRIPINRSRVLSNLYNGQIKKIRAAILKLHEDLQYDYNHELESLIQ
ncbi:MAG: hypothetical protein AAFZ15_10560 [Bacteroidota bacterium]